MKKQEEKVNFNEMCNYLQNEFPQLNSKCSPTLRIFEDIDTLNKNINKLQNERAEKIQLIRKHTNLDAQEIDVCYCNWQTNVKQRKQEFAQKILKQVY